MHETIRFCLLLVAICAGLVTILSAAAFRNALEERDPVAGFCLCGAIVCAALTILSGYWVLEW